MEEKFSKTARWSEIFQYLKTIRVISQLLVGWLGTWDA